MFDIAIQQMHELAAVSWGPRSFREYCRENNIRSTSTAKHISIDSLKRLHATLKKHKCMVFRLGAPDGKRNTHFGLSMCLNGWEDYFLLDDVLFAEVTPVMFTPTGSSQQLLPFHFLPAITESSLVNLALASGLMAHALGLEVKSLPLAAAATSQSTFTFQFKPRPDIKTPWIHSSGQVQIDSLFTASRAGTETAFVLESKSGSSFDSLAKHKLLYPLLAIRNKVPPDMPVVPVYMRIVKRADGYHFYFAECELQESSQNIAVLSGLRPVSQKHHVISFRQIECKISY